MSTWIPPPPQYARHTLKHRLQRTFRRSISTESLAIWHPYDQSLYSDLDSRSTVSAIDADLPYPSEVLKRALCAHMALQHRSIWQNKYKELGCLSIWISAISFDLVLCICFIVTRFSLR